MLKDCRGSDFLRYDANNTPSRSDNRWQHSTRVIQGRVLKEYVDKAILSSKGCIQHNPYLLEIYLTAKILY